jgi:hypothetical protein
MYNIEIPTMTYSKDISELLALPECLKVRVGFFCYYILKLLSEQDDDAVSLKKITKSIPSFDTNSALYIFQQLDAIEIDAPFSRDANYHEDTKVRITATGRELLGKFSAGNDLLKEEFDALLDCNFPTLCNKRDILFIEVTKEYDNEALHELNLTSPYFCSKDDEVINIIRTIRQPEHNILNNSLKSRSFLKQLYANAFTGGGFSDLLGQVREIHIFMDTDVLVSSIIEQDSWHFSTISILNSIARLNRKIEQKDISIIIYITNKVMEDFISLINTVGNVINKILYSDVSRQFKGDLSSGTKLYSNSLLREYFDNKWGTVHGYQTDIYTRLCNLISIYNIKLFSAEDEEKALRSCKGNIDAATNRLIDYEENRFKIPVSLGRRAVLTTDANVVYLVRKATTDYRFCWLWTYHRALMRLEKEEFTDIKNVIHNLFLLGALQLMEMKVLKNGVNSSFIDNFSGYVRDYYNIMLTQRDRMQREFDELKKSIINYVTYVYAKPLEIKNKLYQLTGGQDLKESKKIFDKDISFITEALDDWKELYRSAVYAEDKES